MIKNTGIVEQVRLWDGCQSYWKLDETSGTFVADSIGGNNGILTDGAFNSGGKNGYCYYNTVAGTNGINCGNIFNFEYNNSFTLNIWIKPTSLGVTHLLFSKQAGATSYRGYWFDITALNKLKITLINNNTSPAYRTEQEINSPTISQDVWTMCTATYSGTGDASGVKLYINGVNYALTNVIDTLSGRTMTTTANFCVAGYSLGGASVRGYADEAAVWNRALDAAEVKALYSAGNGKFYGTKALISSPILIPNLKAWYGDYVNNGTLRTPLTGSTNVTQWDDLSGNAFHLDNVSGTTTYEATTKGILLTNGCIYNVNHNIVTGSTARTIFTVVEATNTSTLTDTFHLGLYDGNNHEWGENMRNADYTIASNDGYARYNVTNSNNTKYLFTTTLNGTSIYNNASVRRNGININRSSGVNATLNNYVGIIVGGYFGTGTYTPVKRGSGLTVSEIIIYDRLLTNAEIGQVENWLKNKYSLT